MAQKTAMHQMLDELMAHEYTIPLELIVECKKLIELEKEQILNASRAFADYPFDEIDIQQYYKETYNK